MILEARFVKRPQSDRSLFCDNCGQYISGALIRLYGMAHYGEKPYTTRMHVNCVGSSIETSQEPKIEAALAKAQAAGVRLSYENQFCVAEGEDLTPQQRTEITLLGHHPNVDPEKARRFLATDEQRRKVAGRAEGEV